MAIIIGVLVLWLAWKLAWKLLKWVLILAVLTALAQGGCHDKTQKPAGKAKVMNVKHNQ
ncbi:MAG: hypothetical protein M1547_03080 [Gammaproteobacteria bacterium]|nr:hypothetical protein [Gammaproteobacteria bacterium]